MIRRDSVIPKILIVVAVCITLFSIIIFTNKPRESTVGETVLSYTVLPIQRGAIYLQNWIMGYKHVFPLIADLKSQNKKLEKENANLKEKTKDYDLIKNENIMLKEQMNLTNKYPEYKTLTARVIAEDPNNWYEVIIINQGSDNGIKEGMTVIADKGLVGYVKEVSKDSSKVLCIIDPGNSVSARLSNSREAVVCRGELGLKDSSKMKVIYIPTEIDVLKGDVLETSGLGGIYKKGIKIGEISEIVKTKNALESYAVITTAVDFSTLEYVIVILD